MSHFFLPRSAPEAQGVSSQGVLSFIEAANCEIKYLHSFMLLRHGHVIAEGWWAPYQRDERHILFSLSKSFTSTAIGFAVQEGLLSLDDAVASFFPEDTPADASDHLKAMTLRHILAMAGGQDVDSTDRAVTQPEGNWVRGFLSAPVPYPPGTHFVYNSAATYMCSAILQKVTGQTLIKFLTPRLFKPLGIKGAWWESDPRGINVGGWGLNITTEDIAKFGQFYLQKGVWQGKRLLAESWVDEATRKQVDNSGEPNPDWRQGYGYQFWRCRHNAYRGDGAYGQYCVVMPDQDAVMAITSGVGDMQAVLDKVWAHLLPAMQPAPLPADQSAHNEMQRVLNSLSMPVHAGANTSPLINHINGKTYHVDANPMKIKSLRIEFEPDRATLIYTDKRGEHAMPIGIGQWVESEMALLAGNRRWNRKHLGCAGSGAWESENTFAATLAMTNTPFHPRLACTFEGDEMRLDFAFDRFMGPAPELHLSGKRELVTAQP
jgi:CubicO group peptidase (beta-lactamase class C family)